MPRFSVTTKSDAGVNAPMRDTPYVVRRTNHSRTNVRQPQDVFLTPDGGETTDLSEAQTYTNPQEADDAAKRIALSTGRGRVWQAYKRTS